jgi:adenylate cyclase
MGKEIERKFLVIDDLFLRSSEDKVFIEQGFLSLDKDRVVRVRIAGARATITIKGSPTGITRPEFEYEIPVADARELLDDLCMKPTIKKHRHRINFGGLDWELDVFEEENRGLVLAEIELESEEQQFDPPPWLGEEVTADPKYYNVNLTRNPFPTWGDRVYH